MEARDTESQSKQDGVHLAFYLVLQLRTKLTPMKDTPFLL